MNTYALIETYCDNWVEAQDYREMPRFDAPARPNPGAASLAKAWDVNPARHVPARDN
jgi:hypothetical protein